MTLDLLSETGVGKAVNQLRNHDQYGTKAVQIVEKWKDMARSCGLKQRRFLVFKNNANFRIRGVDLSKHKIFDEENLNDVIDTYFRKGYLSPSSEQEENHPKKSKKGNRREEKGSNNEQEVYNNGDEVHHSKAKVSFMSILDFS